MRKSLPEFLVNNVSVKDTIRGFKMILNGELDHVSENDFYMKGTIDEVWSLLMLKKLNLTNYTTMALILENNYTGQRSLF